jgi:hypothetical protein
MEQERSNNINYLDISVNRGDTNVTYKMYRKPTSTNTAVHTTRRITHMNTGGLRLNICRIE